uniref:Ig-like domain-containing protein n=1 Tax=Gouania willdenowi TaxID=441366 RepID=A0A8C5DLR3_GOUWI
MFFRLNRNQMTTVSCLYNSSCFLSCHYKTGKATIIHWTYMTGGDVTVHSFYYDRDQLKLQDPRYKGRTSLVEDQDTGRPTELLLKNVKVQDEGKYQCFADSEEHGYKTSTVVLQVDGAAVWSPAALCDSPLCACVVFCTVRTRLNKLTTTTMWRNPSEEHNTIKC